MRQTGGALSRSRETSRASSNLSLAPKSSRAHGVPRTFSLPVSSIGTSSSRTALPHSLPARSRTPFARRTQDNTSSERVPGSIAARRALYTARPPIRTMTASRHTSECAERVSQAGLRERERAEEGGSEREEDEGCTLLVHGEHDAAAEHQARKARRRAAPEPQDALLGKDARRAVERVAVLRARLERLHARLDDTAGRAAASAMSKESAGWDEGRREDALEGHGRVDGDDAGDGADRKRDPCRERLSWPTALDERLRAKEVDVSEGGTERARTSAKETHLERAVRREAHRRVGTLPCRLRRRAESVRRARNAKTGRRGSRGRTTGPKPR
mgnify:CR=1 FL=1